MSGFITNKPLDSILGALNTAAASGDPTDTDAAMAYIKQLVTNSEHLVDVLMHETTIFPTATNLTCVLTAHANANTWSAWAEIADSAATKLSTAFASKAGHITAMEVEETNVASVLFMVELAYGEAKTIISRLRFISETNQVAVAQVPRLRGSHIPAGETIYYRLMCATGAKTANVYFRYFLE